MNRHAFLDKVMTSLRTDSSRSIARHLLSLEGADRIASDDGSRSIRTDSDAMIFAARQLEHVMAEVYEEDFPDLPAADGDILSIDSSVPEGAKTWSYYLYTGTAVARVAASFSDSTLPRVTRAGAEINHKIVRFENEWAMDTDDLRYAAFAGVSLESDLGKLARRGHEQIFHRTALWGLDALGIRGFLNHPNITILTADKPVFGEADPADNATGDEILETFRQGIETVADTTHRLRRVSRVAMSPRVMSRLKTLRVSDGSGDGTVTVFQQLQKLWSGENDRLPKVEFVELEELDYTKAQLEADDGVPNVDIDATSGDVAIFYVHNKPEVARFVRPMPFKEHPMQADGLHFKVPCESKYGGLRLPEPLTIVRMEGMHL